MTTRTYDSRLRRQRQAELERRIAAAAATLHAQKGVRGTSYADIAAQANVSLPTVYARFPTQEALLAGCTAHVGATAPGLPVERVLAARDLRSAADTLTDAIVQKHLHFEPWLAWRGRTRLKWQPRQPYGLYEPGARQPQHPPEQRAAVRS